MTLEDFIQAIKSAQPVEFSQTLAIVDTYFDYTPCTFSNGAGKQQIINTAGQNEGSCKIFSLAHHLGFNQQETLACFGDFYQQVLASPEGKDHMNIRNFMKFGWSHIQFIGQALEPKSL
ncbi:HopJ type III effector protein [Allopseudospirillum japonicum]|uniref:HopJ type III effector protein n=1 Tax=Allopseudospirillum japonicum TaxID=64971 RepID=A0A1H6U550_9GAMM|nr:HopJ type III effector protein [Allopseudospirillum japonicum]SEI83500.1 HopJ type III effector protein [Allopseudospirillum japonicum]